MTQSLEQLQKLHLYEGSIDQAAPCDICAGPARNPQHIMNGGNACDMLRGPCACGAWH